MLHKVHSFMYSYIPFVLLSIISILLSVELKRMENSRTQCLRLKQNSHTAMAMTLMFIIFTLPTAVVSKYYNTLVLTFEGNIILFAANSFTFSYHAFNIFILCIFNEKFLNSLKNLFTKNSQPTTQTHNSQNVIALKSVNTQ